MLEKRKYKYKKAIYIYGIIIFAIAMMIWTIYINQRNTLINLRCNEMISIAKISANNLKSYFEEKIDCLNSIFMIDDELLGQGIDIEKYIESKIETIAGKNNGYEGNIRYISNDLFDIYLINEYDLKECVIGPVIFTEDSNYIIQIVKPIFINSKAEGIVLVEYLLDEVYKETLGKIQVGEYGYCTLKDENGYILMHEEKNQIGLDSLSGRKEKYPELDPEDIETLVNNQINGKVGSDIVKTYWWGNPELGKVKKIIGYSPIEIGGHKFIVSATTSYDEIAMPITRSFYLILGLGIILIILLIIFITDINRIKNEQKNMLIELKYSEELNKATNKLRKHEEKLSKLNRIHTLGMVVGTIAHEFKNLLTPIFIYNEMLMNNLKSNKEAIEDLNEINIAANNCLELSQSLLAYSKDEVLIVNEWFDSCDELLKIINLLKAILPKNIKITNSIDKEKIILYGNRREFKQIVLNICTNAYQAMESNGGILDIKYYMEKSKAVLLISDMGCGIEEEVINKIFEPFYTSKADNGTGLGLSIVVELLKNMNGTIKIDSEKDKGTRVKIEINIVEG